MRRELEQHIYENWMEVGNNKLRIERVRRQQRPKVPAIHHRTGLDCVVEVRAVRLARTSSRGVRNKNPTPDNNNTNRETHCTVFLLQTINIRGDTSREEEEETTFLSSRVGVQRGGSVSLIFLAQLSSYMCYEVPSISYLVIGGNSMSPPN